MLTIYDSDGNYGHPDHIQVHRVGLRAAELAGTPQRVRGHDQPRPHQAGDAGGRRGGRAPRRGRARPPTTSRRSGGRSRMITTTVDVREFLEQKRASMAAHASQIAETSFFLAMPPEQFEAGLRARVVHPPRRARRTTATTTLRRPRVRPLLDHWTHTALAQQLVFGAGSLDRLPEVLKAHRGAQGDARHDGGPAGVAGRRAGGAPARPQPRDRPSPRWSRTCRCRSCSRPCCRRAATRSTLVVSFGGGSCADLGKAVCFFLEQEAGMPGRHPPRPARAPARQHPHHLLRAPSSRRSSA